MQPVPLPADGHRCLIHPEHTAGAELVHDHPGRFGQGGGGLGDLPADPPGGDGDPAQVGDEHGDAFDRDVLEDDQVDRNRGHVRAQLHRRVHPGRRACTGRVTTGAGPGMEPVLDRDRRDRLGDIGDLTRHHARVLGAGEVATTARALGRHMIQHLVRVRGPVPGPAFTPGLATRFTPARAPPGRLGRGITTIAGGRQ